MRNLPEPDEFGPYLEDAMRDHEFRAAYEHARREPIPFERALERSRWRRWYWRYLRRFPALTDKVRFELAFARAAATHVAQPGSIQYVGEAVAIAQNIKGRVPW